MDIQKRNVIILTIIGIIILIVMTFGVTYAMFMYTGTGTKENVIVTGSVEMNYAESSKIELTNQYPMSDELGLISTDENNEMKFSINASINAETTVNYAIAIDAIIEGETLTEDFVKVYLLKGDTVVSTFINGEGKKIGDLKSSKIEGILGGYVLYTDSFTTSGSQEYTIKAWVSDDYKLPTIVNGNNSSTTSEIFKFKIKVVATDALLTVTNTTI